MTQKITVKKVYDTIRDFVYDTKCGCNFLAKKAKKGCMTQKCMTQNVRPLKIGFLILTTGLLRFGRKGNIKK